MALSGLSVALVYCLGLAAMPPGKMSSIPYHADVVAQHSMVELTLAALATIARMCFSDELRNGPV